MKDSTDAALTHISESPDKMSIVVASGLSYSILIILFILLVIFSQFLLTQQNYHGGINKAVNKRIKGEKFASKH